MKVYSGTQTLSSQLSALSCQLSALPLGWLVGWSFGQGGSFSLEKLSFLTRHALAATYVHFPTILEVMLQNFNRPTGTGLMPLEAQATLCRP